MEEDVIQHAVSLVRHYPLRAADAIQLATAIQLSQALQEAQLGPAIVVSADDRILEAAPYEGLTIENPNLL
jgi:predicted nucleic acid-binding protein